MSAHFDRRLTPARGDIAAERLRGAVEAERFVPARRLVVRDGTAPVRRSPRPDAPLDTEALYGEAVDVYDTVEGWAWGQLAADLYVGWLPEDALTEPDGQGGDTRVVAALRTFVYPTPDIKTPPLLVLPMGAAVEAREAVGRFVRIAPGFVYAAHLRPSGEREADPVAVAERFLGVPYLWGGKTALGLDCSGLVQLSLRAAGIAAPRDSDMMEQGLGEPVGDGPLRRGDLVFWKGHVGILRDAQTLLHANGEAMAVTAEPLETAKARILAGNGGPVTAIRRVRLPAPA